MQVALKNVDNSVFDQEEVEVDGVKYTVKARNPWGFYNIYQDKGRLPDALKGSYTGKKTAIDDIKKYAAEKNRTVTV